MHGLIILRDEAISDIAKYATQLAADHADIGSQYKVMTFRWIQASYSPPSGSYSDHFSGQLWVECRLFETSAPNRLRPSL